MRLTSFLLMFHVHAIPLFVAQRIYVAVWLSKWRIFYLVTLFVTCFVTLDVHSHRYSKFILFQGVYRVGNILLLCWFEGGEYFAW